MVESWSAQLRGMCRRAGLLRVISHLLAAVVLTTSHGATADEPALIGPADDGLAGLDHIGMPIGAEDISVAASVGYGLTESLGQVSGLHHRVVGKAAIGVPVIAGFSASLMLDGRFDMHPDDGLGRDVGGVGEPRLLARYGAQLSPDFQLGGEVDLRMPGASAPSIQLSATTVELKVLAALLSLRPLSLHGLLGFRFDNSAHAAPDRTRLREGDRIALGLSDGNHLLFGLGGHLRFSEASAGFLEATFEPMLGHGEVLASPLRLSLGVRQNLTRTWLLEGKLTGSFSRRPDISPDAPLVPIEPRVALIVGLRYTFADPPAVLSEPPSPDLPEDKPEEPVVQATAGPLSGTLVTEGGEPFAGARVKLTRGEATWETESDAQGAYSFANIPFGELTLETAVEGYTTETWTVQHGPEAAAQREAVVLKKEKPTGQLRGLVRSWNSEPLAAKVTLHDARNKVVAETESNAEGRFQVDLLEGAYKVKVSAPGHRSQERKVRIHYRGVTILNLDLRTGTKGRRRGR